MPPPVFGILCEYYRQFTLDELLRLRRQREQRIEAIKSIYLEITSADRLVLSRVGKSELAYCRDHLKAINRVIFEIESVQG